MDKPDKIAELMTRVRSLIPGAEQRWAEGEDRERSKGEEDGKIMESRKLEEQRQYDALLNTYNDVNVALAALEPTSEKAESRIERASGDVRVHGSRASLVCLLLRDHLLLDQTLQKINSDKPWTEGGMLDLAEAQRAQRARGQRGWHTSVKLDEDSRGRLSSVLYNSSRVLADHYQVCKDPYEREAIRSAAKGEAFELKGEKYSGGSSFTLQDALAHEDAARLGLVAGKARESSLSRKFFSSSVAGGGRVRSFR